ncbi:MAG: transposase, partial [Myxococcota bacterium]
MLVAACLPSFNELTDLYIWNSATKEEAEKELKNFASLYGGKYPKTVECLEKEKKELFTFHAFPEQHWLHIRSTNLIESTFA